jgi:hypothetical protein
MDSPKRIWELTQDPTLPVCHLKDKEEGEGRCSPRQCAVSEVPVRNKL